jgi:hypothetical protein
MPIKPINKIAAEILTAWGPGPRKGFQIYAGPYAEAMLQLTQISDHYGLDDAEDIILRFLVNSQAWRGPAARQAKKELNQHLKEKACFR